jgi:hypothetical protein
MIVNNYKLHQSNGLNTRKNSLMDLEFKTWLRLVIQSCFRGIKGVLFFKPLQCQLSTFHSFNEVLRGFRKNVQHPQQSIGFLEYAAPLIPQQPEAQRSVESSTPSRRTVYNFEC